MEYNLNFPEPGGQLYSNIQFVLLTFMFPEAMKSITVIGVEATSFKFIFKPPSSVKKEI
jgi:hypothetical protein